MWPWGRGQRSGVGSQGAVPCLVFGQNVPAASQFFAQLGNFLPERRVLFLQERGSDGDLVLFEAPRVPGTLRCYVVLPTPCPVLIILQKKRYNCRNSYQRQIRARDREREEDVRESDRERRV